MPRWDWPFGPSSPGRGGGSTISPDTHKIVAVGAIALDVLRWPRLEGGELRIHLRFGGAVQNVACALGILRLRPCFICGRPTGELGDMVPEHLGRHGVDLL